MTDRIPFHDSSLPESITLAGKLAARFAQIALLEQENETLRQRLEAIQDGTEAQATANWLGEILPSDEGDVDNIFAIAEQTSLDDKPLVGLLRAVIARIEADDASGAISLAKSIIVRLTDR